MTQCQNKGTTTNHAQIYDKYTFPRSKDAVISRHKPDCNLQDTQKSAKALFFSVGNEGCGMSECGKGGEGVGERGIFF